MRAVTFPIGFSTAQSDRTLWRRAVSALFSLSFVWISYVSQTHIHGQSITSEAAAEVAKAVQLDGGKAVQDAGKHNQDDSTDCPLCQAVSHGGVAVMPILLALLAVHNVVRSILLCRCERPRASHFGYAHQTRGPPIL